MYTLNCKGKLLTIDEPLVVGIINATTDSFYKGHLKEGLDGIISMAGKMIREGAAILDIGGQSTRPGSERIAAVQEIDRVIPVIEAIRFHFPAIILSIDTYHARVSEAAVKAGASMVNDISGGTMDKEMIATVASLQVPYICMHIKGRPESMQTAPVYEDVVRELLDFFIMKLAECKEAGINDLIIDPGFGFGKNIAHNFQLLKHLALFKMLDRPIMVGISRKSTVYKTLAIPVDQSLNGTTVLNTIALLQGASLLRVHDVKEAKEAIMLVTTYKKSSDVHL